METISHLFMIHTLFSWAQRATHSRKVSTAALVGTLGEYRPADT
jgi:hypothetical protein